LEVAKAIAIGADLGGMALPLFKAQQEGGVDGAEKALQLITAGLRQALVLTGSRSCAELRRKPVVMTGELKDWLVAL
jgi:isopentenyl-diphosphate delta-isomerase